MTETGSLGVAERADVIVRELRESDLPLADVILRSAFDTFTGVASLFGDRDYVRTRWLASPDPDDRRAARVQLTERGRRLLVEMDEPLMAAHVRWWAALTQDEQRQLESLLRKAAAAIASSGKDEQDATRETSSR